MDLLIEIVTIHGWKAVVIALLTFAIIECIKPFARKAIRTANARHTLYTLLNYAVTLGLSALLSVILDSTKDIFKVYGSAIVVVNILYPIIANVGFFRWIEKVVGEFLERTTEKGLWKKAVKELASKFGIDESFVEKVTSLIEIEYTGKILKVGPSQFFTENKTELVLNIKQKLAGFVTSESLQDAAEQLFAKISESWSSTSESKGDLVV